MTPILSVCIPTHTGRADYTMELLDTLQRAQQHVHGAVETIVVDDDSTDAADRLRARCQKLGVTYLRGPRSAGAKRNLAVEHACAELVLFIDSDCLATDTLLAAHLAAMRDAEPDVAGVVGLIQMDGEPTGVWHTIRGSHYHNPCFDYAHQYRHVGWGTTANLLVRRKVFRSVNGFDQSSYTAVGGEDVDLGLRISDAGYTWRTGPHALVIHRRDTITTLRQVTQRLFTYGRADTFLSHQHPHHQTLYVNPYAAAVLATISGRWHPTRMLARGALTAAAALVAEGVRRRYSSSSIYGDHTQRPDGTLREHALWVLTDSAFDAGILAESVRRGRPARAFHRFTYAPPKYFS